MTRTPLALAGSLLLIAGSLTPSAAQTPEPQTTRSDARWASWLGCWQLSDESLDDGSAAMARLLGMPAPRTRENAGALVCVTPAAAGGATMTTYVNDRAVLSETIVPDGTSRAITEAECRGQQRAEWSTLGARMYASAELTCQSQPARKVSGLAMMLAGPVWLDIQAIESNGGKTLRVRRYHRAADQKRAGDVLPPTAATMPLGRALSLSDVKEASKKVVPEVLQAALVELKSGFDLNGKRLLELEDAGVARGVIDLMVALSFPQKFVVERPVARYSGGGGGSWWTPMGYDDLWPYFATPYAFSPFYSSYYAPFGYRYWGYVDPFYYTGPGYVVIDPGSGGGTPSPQPSGEGRVVDGHGYTRVRRSDPDPVIPRTGRNGDGYSTTSSGQSTDGGSNGGSSSGVSSSGYSGGSSGSGDRTAQPRPPGR